MKQLGYTITDKPKSLPSNIIAIAMFIFLSASHLSAQEVLHEENTEAQLNAPINGPNTATYLHFFIGSSMFADQPQEGYTTRYYFTNNFEFGARRKHKLNTIISLGYQLSYQRAKYSIKQTGDKQFPVSGIVPDNINLEKELIRLHQLKPELFIRINFDPSRGNFMGNFIDLGFYGTYNTGKNHAVKYNDTNSNSYIFTRQTRLNYIENYEYGAEARLGFNRYIILCQYRISDIVSLGTFELPRLSMGLQVGLHK